MKSKAILGIFLWVSAIIGCRAAINPHPAVIQYTLTIIVTGTGQGHVIPTPAGGIYAAGTIVVLTAVPEIGSVFAGWNGAISGVQNPIPLTMTEDAIAFAAFSPKPPDVPVADFSWNGSPATRFGRSPLIVNFTDLSTNSPTSWFWDFGDGTTSQVQNSVCQYNARGLYTVTLTATNESGTSAPCAKPHIVAADYGPPYWYVGDTFGPPLPPFKTHDAIEAAYAQETLDRMNQERQAQTVIDGIPRPFLVHDAAIAVAPKVHAEDMAARDYYDVWTPEGWTTADRLAMTGVDPIPPHAEIVAAGYATAAAMVTAWMNYASYRTRVLDPARNVAAVGVANRGAYPPTVSAMFATR